MSRTLCTSKLAVSKLVARMGQKLFLILKVEQIAKMLRCLAVYYVDSGLFYICYICCCYYTLLYQKGI